jgi:hypothetical protein
MTALSIQPPFPIFTDTDGSPLENGYIWLGTANQDPQANPITAYWDAALTIPPRSPSARLAAIRRAAARLHACTWRPTTRSGCRTRTARRSTFR